MKKAAMSLAWFVLASFMALGCGSSTTPPPTIVDPSPRSRPHLCTTPLPGVIGVAPLKNDTSARVDLGGTDDLIMASMTESGCFTVAEREQLELVLEELRLCTDKNPDKELFDCTSAPEKGSLVRVTTLVTGSLTFFEANVKGAELAVKIPGIGGIDGGRSYSAMQLSLRAISVETRKVTASVDTHASVPADQAGAELSGAGFTLRAAAHARTPFGDALDTMLQDAVTKLKNELD